jgi:hypothetical protein
MTRKKKYRFKKSLNISREDALYLNKLTTPHLKYVLNKIIREVEPSKASINKKNREKERKSKNGELVAAELQRLKADNPGRTDSILQKSASTKIGCLLSCPKYEKMFCGILESMDILYEHQKVFMNDYTYYVVDFYLPEYNVVCEIDGEIHDNINRMPKDEKRTRVLKTQNKVTDVIRFYNEDVEYNQESVIESLETLLSNL